MPARRKRAVLVQMTIFLHILNLRHMVPRNSQIILMDTVASKVLSIVNAPYGANLSAQQLAGLISDPKSVANFDASAFAFFSEVSLKLQTQFVEEISLTKDTFAKVGAMFLQLAACDLAAAR